MVVNYIRLINIISIVCLLLSGCQNTEEEQTRGFSSSSNGATEISQDLSEQVKGKLEAMKDVERVHAVNLDNDVYISLSVSGFQRFFLKRIREEAHHLAKKNKNASSVHVTTDKKIEMELKELETKIQHGSISKKQLEKEIKKLEEDMKG